MLSRTLGRVAILLAVLAPVVGAQTRTELLGKPKYLTDAAKPRFEALTAEQIRNAIKVISSRNNAFIGFNDPGVRVHLPRIDNSVYAGVDFGEAKLQDAGKRPVKFELEQGIYDHERYSTEIRFTKPGGGGVVAFARTAGAIKVHYPAAMKTVAIRKGVAPAPGFTVTLDGPYVTIGFAGADPIPEAASFGKFNGLRAYDAAGKALEPTGGVESSSDGTATKKKHAFWGAVTQVEIDQVTKWVDLEIAYDLPAVAALPKESQGASLPAATAVADTPGGQVTKRIVPGS